MHSFTRCRFILPLGVAVLAGPALGQIALDPAITVGTGSQPSGIAIGDFTADGIADLAVVVEAPDRVEIHAGNGLGGYTIAGSGLLPNSSSPGVMAAGDLDGDGDLDLMVALKDFLAVQVMFNQAGTFVAGGQFATGDETKSIAFGDIDGDGDLDAITSNRRDDTATLLVNNGAGSFAGTNFATGGDPRGATFGDFDGDGDLDIAISAHDDRLIDILRNTGGSFSPWTSISTGAQLRPEGVTAADLDGDGDDDLAAAANGAIGNFAAVWLAGGGGFGAMNTYASGGLNTSEIAASDLDCNGLADLVVLNIDSPSVGVLQNLGGTFGTAGVFAVGADPEFMATGDADGDGDQDIAATSKFANTITLATATCGGGGPVCGNGICEPGETTDCVDCQGGGGGPVCGDGVCDPTEGPDCVDCQNNQPGDFTFATSAVAVGTRPGGTAFIDVDGDGDLDLASTVEGPDRVQFTMNMGGSWVPGAFVATGASSSPTEVAAGDLDGDGDDDLLVIVRDLMAVRTLRNDAGIFTAIGDAPVGDRAQGLTLGDVDGDGDLDAAVANRLSDTGTILVNNGAGTFTSNTVSVAGEPRGAAIGNFDADGAIEVAISAHDTRTISFFQASAKGFVADGSVTTGPLVRPEGLATADLNGDGVADLAAAVNGGAAEAVMVWIGGTGGATGGQMFLTNVLNTSFIAAGDFDCDGDMDIAAVGTDSNAVAILAGDGLGGLAPGAPIATGTTPEQIAVGDVDGDGDLDFATANRDSNNATVAINDTCEAPGIPGDLNGDGSVNGADAGLLLAAWGTADPAADLNGSGLVDGADVGLLLANWTG